MTLLVGTNSSRNVHFGLLVFFTLLMFTTVPLAAAHGESDSDSDSNSNSTSNSDSTQILATGNIGLGFGLTTMAAIASAIGSMTPFLDSLFPLLPFWKDFKITESKGFIAGSLSLSSGVLLGLTLGDLFPGSISNFDTSGWFDPKWSSTMATAIFILTIVIIMTLKHLFTKVWMKRTGEPICLCDPTATECRCHLSKPGNAPVLGVCACPIKEDRSEVELLGKDEPKESEESRRLKLLGIQIAAALAVHNFPEGLATFTTTIADPQIGVLFAIALALHKLPEGLIISLPIYFATGSRWKAFIIAGCVGISAQMLGALLGYVLFVTYWNDGISAILFAIVTAVLLYTILHGMLPMAHQYDPSDKYCTYYLFGGLIFFNVVQALFDLSGADA